MSRGTCRFIRVWILAGASFALLAAAAGSSRQITVYATPDAGSSASAKVTLTAVSESDPTKTAAATVLVSKK